MLSDALAAADASYLTAQPASLKHGTLRAYQLEGLNWLVSLHDNGLNGILADEMGLGKTVQTIALLAYLQEARGLRGPHLVVVPKSTLGNWEKEFGRWCPSLSVLRFQGSKADRAAMVAERVSGSDFDVLLTTYETVTLERASIRRVSWSYVIVDEAHRIKSEKGALSQELRRLDSAHRLLITGTPLQNNLHELWALLNFLMPDVFGSSDDFDSWFTTSGDGGVMESVARRMHVILRPFLLQRLKKDVEKSLLPKIETKLLVGLTALQRDWYRKLLERDTVSLGDHRGGGPAKVRLLNVLMQLRKVCNHPYLFDGAEPTPHEDGPHLWEACGKMQVLHKLLGRLREQGSRVLIFSQMTRMLDILEDYMRFRGVEFCRIDGNTDGVERDEAMEAFNAEGSTKDVFLLSTRAGGLGINLYTADVVVLYDSDWNPQMDLQAMDRAHRIGQKKQVRVFRLVTETTVEEKIVERAERKLYLDAMVIQRGRLAAQNKALSRDELLTMVTFGADEVFKGSGSAVTDEDIDAILARGREQTEESRSRIKRDMQHNLGSFTLDALAGADSSIYLFDKTDYSKLSKVAATGSLVDLGRRERKSRADGIPGAPKRRRRPARERRLAKMPAVGPHNFVDEARLKEVVDLENDVLVRRLELEQRAKAARKQVRKGPTRWAKDRTAELIAGGEEPGSAAATAAEEVGARLPELEAEAEAAEAELLEVVVDPGLLREKEALLAAGFPSWSRSDFRRLMDACEIHGRDDRDAVVADTCEETGKPRAEVSRYFDALWRGGKGRKGRIHELPDAAKLLDAVARGEERIERRVEVEDALGAKVARYPDPWRGLKLDYKLSRSKAGRQFTEEEDRFLACVMDDTGYGEWATAAAEIRRAHQFRFDWFVKTRTEADLQKRADEIIVLVERENARLTGRDGSGDDEDEDEEDDAPAAKGRGRGGRGTAKPTAQRARKRPADGEGSKAKRKR